MFSLRRTICLLVALVLICLNCELVSARTRYEEFDYQECQRATEESDVSLSRLPPPQSCRHFCLDKGYPAGGCDCVTKKCVCANMNLNFCDFARIRLFI